MCTKEINIEFLGIDVTCSYDSDDNELIACGCQDCDFFEQVLSEFYLESLIEKMDKAIKVKTESKKLDIDLSNNKKVSDRKLSLGLGSAA